MLSCFHKTTFERWWRTPGTQKDSPLSLKGGRTKYKRQKDRRVRDGDLPWGGVVKEKFPHSRKPSLRWVFREFWNLTGRGKKPTEDMPNHNCRKQNFPTKGSNLTT